jgi:hypothetical protein
VHVHDETKAIPVEVDRFFHVVHDVADAQLRQPMHLTVGLPGRCTIGAISSRSIGLVERLTHCENEQGALPTGRSIDLERCPSARFGGSFSPGVGCASVRTDSGRSLVTRHRRVYGVPRRRGMSRLAHADRLTGIPLRYVPERPGEPCRVCR